MKYLIILIIFFTKNAFCARQIEEQDFFASLRSSETNVRAGPGQHYPIKFTFKARGVPVHVVSEYDNWNEIEDYEKQTGWVSKSLLTKKRTLMVQTSQDQINMYSKKSEKSRVIFRLKNHVIGDYVDCEENWCMIEIEGKKGWVNKGLVYGN
jgi:SH3-like domain-containing protein